MNSMSTLAATANAIRESAGLAAKHDIATVAERLGIAGTARIAVGDDCAAIPDGDGFLLFAIEGFLNAFVALDPWFAGWCGVMVNVSDVLAMGGRPIAVVDAVWAEGAAGADKILSGMRAAAQAYGLPIVGGHTNLRADRAQLSVAILGRAQRLLTSFDARAGDDLVAAIDLRGQYREPFDNWEAAVSAPQARLRGDMEILPAIAELGLARVAKDISQGGIIGTAAMLADCSRVGMRIDIGAIPKPDMVARDRWLLTFPSYGFLLSTSPANTGAVIDMFAQRDITAARIGKVTETRCVEIHDESATETIWDLASRSLIGCGHA
jgi:AIR synthase-related protein